jgi:hypothetical protein
MDDRRWTRVQDSGFRGLDDRRGFRVQGLGSIKEKLRARVLGVEALAGAVTPSSTG